MSMQESFFAVCKDALPADRVYVSLYVRVPYYGGPEEGGWWGSDSVLVAYYPAESKEQAEELAERVRSHAEELTADARKSHGTHCLQQMEWLEARGLDADYLPEVDGPEDYSVIVEEKIGGHAYRGDRHYS